MSVKQIIFLDIDGVLWTGGGDPEGFNFDAFTVRCVTNLNKILSACPDVSIVISSSWRQVHSLEWLKDHFENEGIDPARVIDVTPSLKRHLDQYPQRGDEIQAWLDNHPEVEKFVIFDDDEDMVHLEDHLICTKFNKGITTKQAELAIERLK